MPPATQTQPPQQAPPQQPGTAPAADAALTAAIVAALAAATTAAALTAALKGSFKAAGIGGAALSAVAALVVSVPHEAVKATGPASRQVMRTNLLRRAQFVLAASRRVQQAIKTARSQNQPAMSAIRDALATEKQYLSQHVAANAGRVEAASAVDGMASTYGNLLGWAAILDDRTSRECRVANGGTFTASKPPIIGFPGAVHPACRCRPVQARSGAPSVNAKLAAAGLA